ncbi:hypothetical protein LLG46_04280 [bacterium]|nr:hypothetical protein [bacterium]
MKTIWIIRLLAMVILVISCGMAFADCHGDCCDGCDCCGTCVHACRCGIIQHCSINPDITYTAFALNHRVTTPSVTTDGIFRPPVAVL